MSSLESSPIERKRDRSESKMDSMEKVRELIKILICDEKSKEFTKPIEYLKLGLATNPKINKRSMNLTTILDNIDEGKYDNTNDALNDIQLIWKNYKSVNIPNTVTIRII